MRFDNGRESENIEDRRGESGDAGRSGFPIGGGSIGLGTIALALVGMYFGINPVTILQHSGALSGGNTHSSAPARSVPPAKQTQEEKELSRFVSMVLADTEDTWQAVFKEKGRKYVEPKLVMFRGSTRTACGKGDAAMGPFYCPADQKVYIDLEFFQLLQKRFKAPGDFAQAYVIAHEVGHHVQHLLGISEKVQRRRSQLSEAQGNALSVRLELQADCFAGVWAYHADKARQVLESGDVEEALKAATAIGDDTLQKQGQGQIVPESFTHGSSAQRVRWFKTGLESGKTASCNTFKGSIS